VQGAQGVQGATGTGTQGAQGAQGTQGTTGTGTQGTQGAQGAQGTTGTGTQGLQGSQGAQGAPGTGTQGTQGAQGHQGAQGAAGSGTQGAQGAQGAQGTQGTQGTQGGGAAGGATRVLRTRAIPLLYRSNLTNAGGTTVVYGIYNSGSYVWMFRNLASQVTRATQDAIRPDAAAAAFTNVTSPINFANANYMGYWEYQARSAQGTTCLVFSKSTANCLRINGDTLTSQALTGLPGGFDIAAMWGSYNMVWVVVNNRVYRFNPPSMANNEDLPTTILFEEVTNTQINAITTKTKCLAQDSQMVLSSPGVYYQHFIVWGTAPANTAAFWNGVSNTWYTLTLPFNHNGYANTFIVMPDGTVGAYNSVTPFAYWTCNPAVSTTAWTNRYNTTSARRCLLFFQDGNGNQESSRSATPAFAGNGGTAFWAEVWPNQRAEAPGMRSHLNNGTNTATWPAEFYCAHKPYGGQNGFLPSNAATYLICNNAQTRSWVTVAPGRNAYDQVTTYILPTRVDGVLVPVPSVGPYAPMPAELDIPSPPGQFTDTLLFEDVRKRWTKVIAIPAADPP